MTWTKKVELYLKKKKAMLVTHGLAGIDSFVNQDRRIYTSNPKGSLLLSEIGSRLRAEICQ